MNDRIIPICLVLSALVVGCRGPSQETTDVEGFGSMPTSPLGEQVTGEGCPSPIPEMSLSAPREEPPAVIDKVAVWTASGDVAIIDPDTGTVLSQVAGGGLGGDTDVAWDPWRNRVITFEGDAEGQWGEIATYEIRGGAGQIGRLGQVTLGHRNHEVWVDGIARVTASPYGTVVLEEGYGQRWRLVSLSGRPTPSVPAPRPQSLVVGPAPHGHVRITALTYGFLGNTLEFWTTEVGGRGVEQPAVIPVDDFGVPWAPARWTESADGSLLGQALSGQLWISTVDAGGSAFPLASIPAGIDRVEAFVSTFDHTVAALVSGSADADLVIVRLVANGQLGCSATLDLPGAARKAGSFFSRDLLTISTGHLLAATSAGIFSVTIPSSCPLTPVIEQGFDGDALRGPMAPAVPPI